MVARAHRLVFVLLTSLATVAFVVGASQLGHGETQSAAPNPSTAQVTQAKAQIREVFGPVAGGCLSPKLRATLTKKTEKVLNDLDKGRINGGAKSIATLIDTACVKGNGHVEVVARSYTALQSLLVAAYTSANPTEPADLPTGLIALRNRIQSYVPAGSKNPLADMLKFVSQATEAQQQGDRSRFLTSLAKIVRKTVIRTFAKKPILTPSQGSALLSDTVGLILYVDPVPTVLALREALRTHDTDRAVALFVAWKRDSYRERLANLPAWYLGDIDNVITTNITPELLTARSRFYRMRTTDANPTNEPLNFMADCDGVWRIEGF